MNGMTVLASSGMMASVTRSAQSPISRRTFVRAATMLGCAHLSSRAWGQDNSASLLVESRLRQLATDAPLAMQFRGASASDARAWQRSFGRQLETLLGAFRPPQIWDSVLERTVELPDHIREERLLTAAGRDPVPVYLLRPRGASAGGHEWNGEQAYPLLERVLGA